jgi:hypothetical protein
MVERNQFVLKIMGLRDLSDVFAITFGSSPEFIPVFLVMYVCEVINELVGIDAGRPLTQGWRKTACRRLGSNPEPFSWESDTLSNGTTRIYCP